MNAVLASEVFELPIRTKDGTFIASYSATGLCGLRFPEPNKAAPSGERKPSPAQVRAWHAQTTRALLDVLNGRKPETLPPLDFGCGTGFQRKVWNALTEIPLGQTRGYAELARTVGRAGAVRAVGGACGANPIPVLVPCHRVLAANGEIGGFSGGLDWKRRLLEREGVAVRG